MNRGASRHSGGAGIQDEKNNPPILYILFIPVSFLLRDLKSTIESRLDL
jgi:hypothetical protein